LGATAILRPTVLIVEGPDDQKFFERLIRSGARANDIEIRQMGGTGGLIGTLGGLQVASGFDKVASVAIVRDADLDPVVAFELVQDALRRRGFAIPAAPLTRTVGPPDVTVMILPDPATVGELEDLILRAVPSSGVLDCVDAMFSCVDAAGHGHPTQRSKARLHAYLATTDDPLVRPADSVGLGPAAVFSLAAPAFGQVRAFVEMI
jgi:hypothetical protein